jgi:hypothetical protein
MTPPPDQPLILRKVDHPHAANAFRVIWDGLEVGSIGLQVGASGRTFWRWSIHDNGAPCREISTIGDTLSRDDRKEFGFAIFPAGYRPNQL